MTTKFNVLAVCDRSFLEKFAGQLKIEFCLGKTKTRKAYRARKRLVTILRRHEWSYRRIGNALMTDHSTIVKMTKKKEK